MGRAAAEELAGYFLMSGENMGYIYSSGIFKRVQPVLGHRLRQ